MMGKWDESSVCPWHRDKVRGDPTLTFHCQFWGVLVQYARAHMHTVIGFPPIEMLRTYVAWSDYVTLTTRGNVCFGGRGRC